MNSPHSSASRSVALGAIALVTSIHLDPELVAAPDAGSTFTSITEGPMFDNPGPFETSFWVDYDRDGFLDLFFTGGYETNPGSSGYQNALFRNRGDGTFEQITEGDILTATQHAGAQSWGDYDNDGFADVFIAQWGTRNGVLLRSLGDGAFARAGAGQPITQGDWPSGVWGDFNHDGFLDLSDARGGRNRVVWGSADGTFRAPLLLDNLGGWGRAAADFDNDGWVDLVIDTAPEGRLVLYRNTGNGAFQRVTTGDLPAQAPGFWGLAWGDYDNDGYQDLFAARGPVGSNLLLHNERDGSLRQVTGLGELLTRPGWNPHWVDFDNDGDLDLFVTGSGNGTSALYQNLGDGRFERLTTGSIATDRQADPYGSPWGDYDHNGFMDLFVLNQGGPHHLYRNDGNNNAWIQFLLVGTASNRSGIGAKVRVKARINGADWWQLRELITSEGYDGPGTLRLEFGLGDAARADTVRIEWPSGAVQEFHDVTPRQILTITEPARLTSPERAADGSVQFGLIGATGVTFAVESSNDLANWMPLTTLTNQSRIELITARDAFGATRFYRASGPGPFALTR